MQSLPHAVITVLGRTAASVIMVAIAMKLLAVTTGPAGVGLFALLRFTQLTASLVCCGGGPAPLTQILSSVQDARRPIVALTIGKISLCIGFALCAGIVLVSPWLAPMIFAHAVGADGWLLIWMTIPILLGVIVSAGQGILNAAHHPGAYLTSQLAGNTVMAVFAAAAGMSLPVYGPHVLAWLLTAGLFVSTIGIVRALRKYGLLQRGIATSEEYGRIRHVMGWTVMANILSVGWMLLIRIGVGRFYDLAHVGYVDAALTLSQVSILVFSVVYNYLLLPRLSYRKTLRGRNAVLGTCLRFSLAALYPALMIALSWRHVIIGLLYRSDFAPAADIWRWLIIGDAIRTLSFAWGIVILAHGDAKRFFRYELTANLCYAALVIGLTLSQHRLQDIGLAYTLTASIYALLTHREIIRMRWVRPLPCVKPYLIVGGILLILDFAFGDYPVVAWLTIPIAITYGWNTMPASFKRHLLRRKKAR